MTNKQRIKVSNRLKYFYYKASYKFHCEWDIALIELFAIERKMWHKANKLMGIYK